MLEHMMRELRSVLDRARSVEGLESTTQKVAKSRKIRTRLKECLLAIQSQDGELRKWPDNWQGLSEAQGEIVNEAAMLLMDATEVPADEVLPAEGEARMKAETAGGDTDGPLESMQSAPWANHEALPSILRQEPECERVTEGGCLEPDGGKPVAENSDSVKVAKPKMKKKSGKGKNKVELREEGVSVQMSTPLPVDERAPDTHVPAWGRKDGRGSGCASTDLLLSGIGRNDVQASTSHCADVHRKPLLHLAQGAFGLGIISPPR